MGVGHNGTGTQRDRNATGLGHKGVDFPWGWDTMWLGHNVLGHSGAGSQRDWDTMEWDTMGLKR